MMVEIVEAYSMEGEEVSIAGLVEESDKDNIVGEDSGGG